ncbi:PC-esterase domain-containing protein 1B-like [Penaeus japonicus]|uniref:PC-esterase domain-containing protein 1B-like n=1 Tax=Penaeus japonicus TaxID=27405 RepID=UPI001C715E5A|nr:PC-esterase domain-containing protein 1B-like [Penaeus japonicus]
MADIFRQDDATALLSDRNVLMLGDSNMRSIYRDLIYLLMEGGVIPPEMLRRSKSRNAGHCGDRVVELSKEDTAGRDFVEVRAFESKGLCVRYNFITKVYSSTVKRELKAIEDGEAPIPHVVIMNSCIWDLTRWGANQENNYKKNMVDLFKHLRRLLPDDALMIWLTTLPVSTEKIRGGVMIKQLEFVQHSMEFIVMEANKFAQELCMAFSFNLIDLHYYMRFQLQRRTKDGLHWEPPAVRMMTNFILSHIALSFGETLPGNTKDILLKEAISMAEEAKSSPPDAKPEINLDKEIKERILIAQKSCDSHQQLKRNQKERVKCQAKRTLKKKSDQSEPSSEQNARRHHSVFDRASSSNKGSDYVHKVASYYNERISKGLSYLAGNRGVQRRSLLGTPCIQQQFLYGQVYGTSSNSRQGLLAHPSPPFNIWQQGYSHQAYGNQNGLLYQNYHHQDVNPQMNQGQQSSYPPWYYSQPTQYQENGNYF